MTTRNLAILVIVLFVGVLSAALASIIAFGIARWVGASVAEAINRGGVVFYSAMSLVIALLAVLLPAMT